MYNNLVIADRGTAQDGPSATLPSQSSPFHPACALSSLSLPLVDDWESTAAAAPHHTTPGGEFFVAPFARSP
jgi:hypothetical protein